MIPYCNYKDCRKAYKSLEQSDRPLALLVFVHSRNKLVSEALRDVVDSYYYQKEYKELGDDVHRVVEPELIKSIVACKRIWQEIKK